MVIIGYLLYLNFIYRVGDKFIFIKLKLVFGLRGKIVKFFSF